jgi:hypothetical protein
MNKWKERDGENIWKERFQVHSLVVLRNWITSSGAALLLILCECEEINKKIIDDDEREREREENDER